MSFDQSQLPDPADYYVNTAGLKLTGKAKWRTAGCPFHGGSDSLRINLRNGAFVCMAGCGAKGGDVLAFHMAYAGLGFVEAAKALGAWVADGKTAPTRPTPITARSALEILRAEAYVIAVAAGNLARGVVLTDIDLARLMTATGRVTRIWEMFT
ncbi:CHC2 zinc finger domain-containing protein [Ottowia sp. VDI28]|uniref:CHC2 zinc finger domain-containing protein n=1 Tax=Ottowia sp. VDI28 TaxID=3133968 RepID=UPI003C2EBB9C